MCESPASRVLSKEHRFKSFDGEILVCKEKSPSPEEGFAGVVVCLPPCIYSHKFFDCPVADYSVMDYLAARGFRIFALDPRGFAPSFRPMDGRSITYEVELKDAEALVCFVLLETQAAAVSMVAYGSGAQVACGHALRHPEQVKAMALMDFIWKRSQQHSSLQFKEVLLSQPNGYLKQTLIADGFEEIFQGFVAPEVVAWINSTFTEAPVGPFLTNFEPLPMIKPAEEIRAATMIIRGTRAGITSEEDSLDFLGHICGEIRLLDVLEGAGPIPSLEKGSYNRVLKDISWFLSR